MLADLLLLINVLVGCCLCCHSLLLLELSLLLSFLLIEQSLADLLGVTNVNLVISNESGDGVSAVIDLAHHRQEGNQINQLTVLGVIVPGNNWHSLFWLQHVRRRGVIEDNSVLAAPANFGHVLGEDSIEVGAVLPVEPHGAQPVGVHLIHKGICIL